MTKARPITGCFVRRKIMGEKEAIEILKSQGMTQAEAEDFVKGIKRGLKARREGDRIPWSQVKKELGIK